MIVKYLSYSLGYRQPSTVNRQHEINLFFAKFLYKLVQLFFNSFEYSQSLRAERSEAWQSRFKKINFKNLVSLINEFYKKWIASAEPRNDDYLTLRDDEDKKNYFEIISLLDYGFCYNYGFNHNENNLKNYNSSVNENYNFAFGENCNFVKYFNYDFINIESKNYNLSKIGNYNSLNGSCYDFWRIYFICDNLKDFLFNTKNQKNFKKGERK